MKLIRTLARRMRSLAPLTQADPTRNPACSEFETDNWQLSRFVLQKLVPVVGAHPFPLHEFILSSTAVRRFRRAQIDATTARRFIWALPR